MNSLLSWICPHCDTSAIVGDRSRLVLESPMPVGHLDYPPKPLIVQLEAIVCPNPDCDGHQIKTHLYKGEYSALGQIVNSGRNLQSWIVTPTTKVKSLPLYIPKAIVSDYNEACLIRDLSPKASATLSRRCLQGMIRDFWSIRKNRLIEEIKDLEGKVDPSTWDAIDAVRSVGNIGAHMEKDINVIIDVEPQEAQLLIGLIEYLIKDWYISRHERQESMRKIKEMAATKKATPPGVT